MLNLTPDPSTISFVNPNPKDILLEHSAAIPSPLPQETHELLFKAAKHKISPLKLVKIVAHHLYEPLFKELFKRQVDPITKTKCVLTSKILGCLFFHPLKALTIDQLTQDRFVTSLVQNDQKYQIWNTLYQESVIQCFQENPDCSYEELKEKIKKDFRLTKWTEDLKNEIKSKSELDIFFKRWRPAINEAIMDDFRQKIIASKDLVTDKISAVFQVYCPNIRNYIENRFFHTFHLILYRDSKTDQVVAKLLQSWINRFTLLENFTENKNKPLNWQELLEFIKNLKDLICCSEPKVDLRKTIERAFGVKPKVSPAIISYDSETKHYHNIGLTYFYSLVKQEEPFYHLASLIDCSSNPSFFKQQLKSLI